MAAPDFWKALGPTPLCLAPMVELGDLAFRIMVRRHGVKICWTGMINVNQWNSSKKYRSVLQTAECDKPLVCQISGSIHSDMVSAARSIWECSQCAAVDINLGCCQLVAKRSGYGYFMVDSESKRRDVLEIVKNVSKAIDVPLFVKVRMLQDEKGQSDIDLTVAFCKELEKAGAKLITVHGRPASQDKRGEVNLECIKRVVESVKIPVVANGGIVSKEQAKEMIEATGAAGVMVAQALLKNPSTFDEQLMGPFDVCREYLEIYKQFGGAFEVARRHMFYFLDDVLGTNGELRGRLGKCPDVDALAKFIDDLEAETSKAQP